MGRQVSRRTGIVYFLEAQEVGRVKIGFASGRIRERFYSFRTSSPVVLGPAWTMLGGHSDEQRLHFLFAEERAHGEWFTLTSRIRKYIDTHCQAYVLPKSRIPLEVRLVRARKAG